MKTSIGQGLNDGTNYFSSLMGTSKVNNSNANFTYNLPLFFISTLGSFFKGNAKLNMEIINCFAKGLPDVDFLDDPRGYIAQFLKKI